MGVVFIQTGTKGRRAGAGRSGPDPIETQPALGIRRGGRSL